jgi:hypothetical protein
MAVILAGNRVNPLCPGYMDLYKPMPGKKKLSNLIGMIDAAAASCLARGAGGLLLQ